MQSRRAVSHVGPTGGDDHVLRINAEGTLNVHDAAREAGVARVVSIGSAEEYGLVSESDLPLTEAPSAYWYRNNAASFITDRSGIALRHQAGVANIMWSSDYPHHGNDWPYSRKVIEETMGHIPAEEKALVTGGNATRIWNLDT